ncbi:hypothetical protein, partial [Metasolibacillus meyeri]|uniref:hypothetical protein n=1 Tax=Metasolibacillus meyeri TaxID=1071052 RepID=UPI00187D437C
LILTCLFKQQATLGILFTGVSLPVLISYMILLKVGFHLANPIHLLISYETDLLATNRYITYFFIMFCLLILSFIMSYLVMRAKIIRLRLPGFQSRKKQYQATGRFKLLQFEQLKKKRSGQILITLTLLFVSFGGTVAVVNQQFQTLPEK